MTQNFLLEPPSASPVPTAGVAPSLLVVDDDLIQRRIIGKLGRQAGFSVSEAPSVAEATRILHGHRIDCATIDLSLGEQSGLELLTTISQISPSTLVLIISGSSEGMLKASLRVARDSGLSLHGAFPKPLDLSALRDSLSRAAQKLDCAHSLTVD